MVERNLLKVKADGTIATMQLENVLPPTIYCIAIYLVAIK